MPTRYWRPARTTSEESEYCVPQTQAMAGFWLSSQSPIDGCLDQGGGWNYSISQCQGS